MKSKDYKVIEDKFLRAGYRYVIECNRAQCDLLVAQCDVAIAANDGRITMEERNQIFERAGLRELGITDAMAEAVEREANEVATGDAIANSAK